MFCPTFENVKSWKVEQWKSDFFYEDEKQQENEWIEIIKHIERKIWFDESKKGGKMNKLNKNLNFHDQNESSMI
jgi:hypothetical protein